MQIAPYTKFMAIKDRMIANKNKAVFNICIFIPVALISWGYLHMCYKYNTIWLFNTIVHENGRYTLTETIFYFRHFLWEMPMKTLYAFFIVGLFHYYGKPVIDVSKNRHIQPLRHPDTVCYVSTAIVFGIVVIALWYTANAVGLKDAVLGMLQYRTSETRALLYGSHWRNHFLSNIVLYTVTASSVLCYRIVCYQGKWQRRGYSWLVIATMGGYAILSIVFGFSKDPFANANYLGHQLREIFGTDLPITMLFSMALLVYLEGKYDLPGTDMNLTKAHGRIEMGVTLLSYLIPAGAITGFIIIRVLSFDISEKINDLGATQQWNVLDLFAWHFFEHSLDYLYTLSLIYVVYRFTLGISLKRGLNE